MGERLQHLVDNRDKELVVAVVVFHLEGKTARKPEKQIYKASQAEMKSHIA